MNDRPAPGWIYVLTHPAWDGLGMVKVGRTGRNPRTRAAEITNVGQAQHSRCEVQSKHGRLRSNAQERKLVCFTVSCR